MTAWQSRLEPMAHWNNTHSQFFNRIARVCSSRPFAPERGSRKKKPWKEVEADCGNTFVNTRFHENGWIVCINFQYSFHLLRTWERASSFKDFRKRENVNGDRLIFIADICCKLYNLVNLIKQTRYAWLWKFITTNSFRLRSLQYNFEPGAFSRGKSSGIEVGTLPTICLQLKIYTESVSSKKFNES